MAILIVAVVVILVYGAIRMWPRGDRWRPHAVVTWLALVIAAYILITQDLGCRPWT